MNEQIPNPARERLENAINNSIGGIELDYRSIFPSPDSGQETMTINLALPAAQAHENLEQIQDNGQAIESITTMLNLISLMQAKPPCDNCKEWHDIAVNSNVVAGLYQGLRSISRYSDLLAQQTKHGLPEGKEAEAEQ